MVLLVHLSFVKSYWKKIMSNANYSIQLQCHTFNRDLHLIEFEIIFNHSNSNQSNNTANEYFINIFACRWYFKKATNYMPVVFSHLYVFSIINKTKRNVSMKPISISTFTHLISRTFTLNTVQY